MEFSIGWVLSLIRRARLREITEELWEEYLTARLDVLLPQGDRVELRDCGTEYFGARSAVVLTAWNPMGEEVDLEENERKNAELAMDLADLSVDFLPCIGSSADTSYREAGFIAFDLDEELAIGLLRKYRQLGYYFALGRTIECRLSDSDEKREVKEISTR